MENPYKSPKPVEYEEQEESLVPYRDKEYLAGVFLGVWLVIDLILIVLMFFGVLV